MYLYQANIRAGYSLFRYEYPVHYNICVKGFPTDRFQRLHSCSNSPVQLDIEPLTLVLYSAFYLLQAVKLVGYQ